MIRSRSCKLLVASLSTFVAFAAVYSSPAQAAEEPDAKPKQPIAKQILGPWSIDIPKTLAAMIRRAEKDNGGKEIEQQQRLLMATMVDQMAGSLQLNFGAEGTVKAHRPEKTENAAYKITESEEASGEFTMSVTPQDEDDPDIAKCKVTGDKMVMGVEDGKFEIHLKRLTEDEAKAHRDQMKKKDDFDKDSEDRDKSETETNE